MDNSIDREKVVKGLMHCIAWNGLHECQPKVGDDCPYVDEADCKLSIMYDAFAVLKEQKHSKTFIVIDNKTGKEADTYNIALHEDWAKHLCYCDMEGWAIEENGTLLLVDECGQFAYADRERFKVKWDG